MTVEKEVKAVEKRTVLVAVRTDPRSQELLNWALVKVAEPGDHVVALHISREASSKDKNVLGVYLEDYEGLCHVKQVHLSGQTFLGGSVKKVLVKEAKKHGAVAVVVGISKKNAFRSWASMARYCAKRLPPSTEVLAVHKGKVIFRSCSSSLLPGLEGDPKPSIYHWMGNSVLKQSQSELGDSVASESRDCKDEYVGLAHEHKKLLLRSNPLSSEGHSEERPGWPLLQRSFSVHPQTMEARNMSVVQWVMTLPNRSPPETPPKAESPSPNNAENLIIKNNGQYLSVEARIELQKELNLILSSKSCTCQWFSYDVLRTCTSHFSSDNLIGKGGCNRVYKGILPNGKPVAVKILNSSSKEARKDFVLEIEIVSSLKHKNILPLLGICIQDDLISVYGYLPGGSLEDSLNDNDKGLKSVLPWGVRFKMAVQIAEALNYLHNDCFQPVIHRDVKSSNILLSNELEAQLSDFGLAIWGPKTSFVLNQGAVFGTFGYLAPEYFMYGKVSDKIDVYSFGVVLLELLSGRKSICFGTPKGQESLVIWAKSKLESGDIKSLLDPNLNGSIDEAQVQRMAFAAALCITRTARLRPNMSHILNLLRGETDECLNAQIDGDENPGEDNDDEVYPESSVESHLSLALLNVDDDSTSSSSLERRKSVSIEDYQKEASRLSSFS